jgi:uncharacterized Zn finger protein (UPF0148 family)
MTCVPCGWTGTLADGTNTCPNCGEASFAPEPPKTEREEHENRSVAPPSRKSGKDRV